MRNEVTVFDSVIAPFMSMLCSKGWFNAEHLERSKRSERFTLWAFNHRSMLFNHRSTTVQCCSFKMEITSEI